MQPPPTKNMIWHSMSDIIATVDAHAREVNKRWGINRLPHVVPIEWTERFKRQKAKWELAAFECIGSPLEADLERVRGHGEAMIRAYAKLEDVALQTGVTPTAPGVWEFELPDGRPIVLVRTIEETGQVERRPGAQVWSLNEIATIITKFPTLVLVKEEFPQAEVIQMRTSNEVTELLDDCLSDIPGFD